MQSKSGIDAALAVVVVYERRWREVHAAELLEEVLLRGVVVDRMVDRSAANADSFDASIAPRLGGLLIYDNSPEPIGRPAEILADCDYVHDASNGGTRAAYARGLALARSRGLSWLILLDHDTTLSAEYFDELDRELVRSETVTPLQDESRSDSHAHSLPEPVGLLLPRVIGESGVLSPAIINRWGTIIPIDPALHSLRKGVLTAVASGSAIRVDALAAVGTIPSALWLDFLDHWLFRQVQKLGYQAQCLSSTIRHDLSIRSATPPSRERLRNILSAERVFTCTLGLTARIAYPFRLLLRALRMLPSDRGAARLILQQLVTPNPQHG